MPHDKNGELLQVGDIVTVECKVKDVYETEGGGYCNLTAETIEPMYPTVFPTTITFNARQVVKKQ